MITTTTTTSSSSSISITTDYTCAHNDFQGFIILFLKQKYDKKVFQLSNF